MTRGGSTSRVAAPVGGGLLGTLARPGRRRAPGPRRVAGRRRLRHRHRRADRLRPSRLRRRVDRLPGRRVGRRRPPRPRSRPGHRVGDGRPRAGLRAALDAAHPRRPRAVRPVRLRPGHRPGDGTPPPRPTSRTVRFSAGSYPGSGAGPAAPRPAPLRASPARHAAGDPQAGSTSRSRHGSAQVDAHAHHGDRPAGRGGGRRPAAPAEVKARAKTVSVAPRAAGWRAARA